MNKKLYSAILAGTAALTIGLGATSANAATVNATANADIVAPVTLTENVQLNFGTIAPATSPGTVTINAGGNQVCATVSCLGGGALGAFTVTGLANEGVDISTDASTSLTGPGAAMAVNSIAPSVTSATLSGLGAATFTVTGILTVNANQVAGSYNGFYDVTANYN